MKEVGKGLREKKNVTVPGVEIRFREGMGDFEREIVCGSFEELKKAHDAGLIGSKEEGEDDEDESGAGGDETEGKGIETDDASASKEADAETGDEGSKDPEDNEVKSEDKEITAKDAAWIFVSLANAEERKRMADILRAMAEKDERQEQVKTYHETIGLDK